MQAPSCVLSTATSESSCGMGGASSRPSRHIEERGGQERGQSAVDRRDAFVSPPLPDVISENRTCDRTRCYERRLHANDLAKDSPACRVAFDERLPSL